MNDSNPSIVPTRAEARAARRAERRQHPDVSQLEPVLPPEEEARLRRVIEQEAEKVAARRARRIVEVDGELFERTWRAWVADTLRPYFELIGAGLVAAAGAAVLVGRPELLIFLVPIAGIAWLQGRL